MCTIQECVLSRSVYYPGVCTIQECVLSRSVYYPGVCTIQECVPSRSVYYPGVCTIQECVLSKLRRYVCMYVGTYSANPSLNSPPLHTHTPCSLTHTAPHTHPPLHTHTHRLTHRLTHLGEVAHYVAAKSVHLCQHVEPKWLHVKVEGLVVQEELCKKTEVLAVDLMVFTVNFKHRQCFFPVDLSAGWSAPSAFYTQREWGDSST